MSKKITFRPREFELEGGLKNAMTNLDKGTEQKWNKFIKPG